MSEEKSVDVVVETYNCQPEGWKEDFEKFIEERGHDGVQVKEVVERKDDVDGVRLVGELGDVEGLFFDIGWYSEVLSDIESSLSEQVFDDK